jgi:hypothetical protein
MLDLFLDTDFYCSIPNEAKTKCGIKRTPFDKLSKLCEDIAVNEFQLRTSKVITKEDVEKDPILEYFVEHCKKHDKEIKLEPVANLNSQIAFLNTTSSDSWIESGYDFISIHEFVNTIENLTYEFDIDVSKNTPYEEIQHLLSKINLNFNFIIVEDYYLGNENNPFLFEEFLKTASSSLNCNKQIEFVIITDFNESSIKKIFENYCNTILKYIHHYKLLIIKPPSDNSIHDRRIWTNSRQFYSGMGFSGKDKKGFLKMSHFSKSTFSKNPKIQFKNQYLHLGGVISRIKAVNYIKELIRKAENSIDGKIINFFPLDTDGSNQVKHFDFLDKI